MSNPQSKSKKREETPAPPTARILTPGEHPITLEMIDADALLVLRKLHDAGFSAYLVGGGVRDLYLGKTPKDFDISTNAHPGQIRKVFRNSMTIGRRFRLVQVFFRNGKTIEVSTLRSLSEFDIDGPQTVLAPNNTFGSLEEDAGRRDLTINSLFFEIENKTIIDYVGGIADLNLGIVRIVGDPDKRISRDPVRMLRAIRHAARIDFTIEPQSWQAICRHHHELALCPPSRLRDELFKDLHSGSLLDWFHLAAESGLFGSILGLYKKILAQPSDSGPSCKEQLTSLFTVIDRVTKKMTETQIGQRLANEFLLALLLLPWANTRFDLIRMEPKGPAAHQLGKQLRDSLDLEIGTQLNLPRASRQEIITLIGNLPLFLQHQEKGSWPQWLTRKSYFKNCLLFYHFYLESTGGLPVPESLLDIMPPPIPVRAPRSGYREKRASRPGTSGPAFASDAPGGIFGFKKKPPVKAGDSKS
ncbi:MAG: polya polymerase [Desulfoarculaceae bacterium]|nr:polya polymerase [Desulfoarculaceae bacterium]